MYSMGLVVCIHVALVINAWGPCLVERLRGELTPLGSFEILLGVEGSHLQTFEPQRI